MALGTPDWKQDTSFVCPICKSPDSKIFSPVGGLIDKYGVDHGTYFVCECRAKRLQEAFLGKLHPTHATPYTSEKFEKLNPFSKNLFITGPQDNTWALLRGELVDLYDSITLSVVDLKDIPKFYVNDGDIRWDPFVEQDLIIVSLMHTLNTEKMNLIYKSFMDARIVRKKPVWFVASALPDRSCFEDDFWWYLNQCYPISILEYPAQSQVKQTMAIIPKVSTEVVPEVSEKTAPVASEVAESFKPVVSIFPDPPAYHEREPQMKKRGRPCGSKNKEGSTKPGPKAKSKNGRFD